MAGTTTESLTARLLRLDLRGGTVELATELSAIHRGLVAELGVAGAHQRFDAALRAALGGHPTGAGCGSH